MKKIFFILFFLSFISYSQASISITLNDSISSLYFQPVKIYKKNDSIKIGYGLIPTYLTNQVIFIDKKPIKSVVNRDEWEIHLAKDIKKMDMGLRHIMQLN